VKYLFRPWRRMRETAYKRGYVDAMVDHASKEEPTQVAHGHALRPSWARVAPAVHEFEDPFLPSDWAKIAPAVDARRGRPTCGHGYEAGSPSHVCAQMPSTHGR
jgi:hypothetical protein